MAALSPLLIPVVAAYLSIAWTAVFHRLWGRRRYRLGSVDYWSSCGGFVALALMITLPLPPVMAEIDRLVGLVGLADTLADVAALLAICSWLVYLSRLVPSSQRWLFSERHGWWVPWRLLLAMLALAIAILAGRFVWAPGQLGFRLGPHPDAGRYYLAGAHLVYRAACLVQLALVILVLRRLATVVGPHPSLQARLRVIRWVLWYMLLYIAYEIASSVVWQLPDLSSRVFRLRSLLLLAAIVAPNSWYVAGLALCRRLATILDAPLAGWRAWRAYRRLYPLWATLYSVQPSVSHLPPPDRWRAWWPDRSVRIALCRVVAEIHDWTIKLWPYQAPHAVRVAEELANEAGLADDGRAALVEAVALAASLANWRAARPVPVRAADPHPGRTARGGTTLAEEIAALVSITDAFMGSPLVAAALTRLEGESAVPRGPQVGGTAHGANGSAAGFVPHV